MAAQETVQTSESILGRSGRLDVILALLLIAIIALFWPTFTWLGSEWSAVDSIFEHGFLLAATAIYLVFRAANSLQTVDIKPCWALLPIVIGLSLAWLLGRVGDVIVVQTTVLPLLILAAVGTLLGLAVAKQFVFAVMFILFAMPVWELLQPILQSITIAVSTNLLEVSGRPVMLDGDLVHLPGGVFRIATGCSGINLLVVGLALAALYGHFYYRFLFDRIKLLGVAAIVAMIANWVRVSSIIYIGDATNMQSSLVHDHQVFGWAIFVVAMVPFYFIAGRIGQHKTAAEMTTDTNGRRSAIPRSSLMALPIVFVGLAIGPTWAAISGEKYSTSERAILSLPEASGDWIGPRLADRSWQPEFRGVSDEAIGQYQSSKGSVQLYSNVYLRQSQGEELIFVLNNIAGTMRKARSSQAKATLDGETFFPVRDIIVDDGLSTHRIWYWYEIDGSMRASDVRAKIWQVLATLKGSPEAGLVAVLAQCSSSCDAAGERIQSFLLAVGDDARLGNRLEIGSN